MPDPDAQPTAAPPPPEEPVAPADLAPAPSRRERLAWYAGAMLLASVLVSAGLRLDSQDLRAPFYYDQDALLYLPLIKTTVETGTHWRNERMGAPGVQELYDFPIIDYVHLGAVWLLSRVTPDFLIAYNLYNLLTYPLTVLTAMIVFRWLRLSLPAAAVGALLYAFLPYHQERYQYHYFLAAYWVVPLSLIPALAICHGKFPLFPLQPDGTRPRRLLSFGAVWPLLLGAVTAASGAYYAFFACATYGFAGAYASVMFRTWRAAASAAWVILPVVAVGLALHVPQFVYAAKYQPNPITDRDPVEAETYGLKLAHLLLPANDHNLSWLSRLRVLYGSPNRPVDGESAGSLGVVGGTGLIALLVMVVLPHRRRWPYGPLAGLVLFLVLLATVGGLGSVFNLLVTAQVRAYNRISVFLGFLCLFAVLWRADRFLLTRTGRWSSVPWPSLLWVQLGLAAFGLISFVLLRVAGVVDAPRLVDVLFLAFAFAGILSSAAVLAAVKRPSLGRFHRWCARLSAAKLSIRYPVLAALFLIGFLDQTPYSWFKQRVIDVTDKHAERFRADRRFFRQIEERSPGARVFCLPYIAFPESPPIHQMAAYEHARGFLMTDTVVWSFGAVKLREADTWQREVAFERPERFLRRIIAHGFDGLFIDGRGYLPRKPDLTRPEPVNTLNPREPIHALFGELVKNKTARLPEVIHEDGKQFFLDLRPYRDALRALDPVTFERAEREERERITVLWLKGFAPFNPVLDPEPHHAGGYDGTVVFVNPTDRTRRIDFSLTLGVEVAGEYRFTFSGLWGKDSQYLDLEKQPGEGEPTTRSRHVEGHAFHNIDLPPGRTTLRIRCTPPPAFVPIDYRKLCYFIRDFKLVEK